MLKARCGPCNVPVGRLTFHLLKALSTSLIPICLAASLSGSTCTRTAYLVEPKTLTWATPVTMEIRCAISVSAYSSSVQSGKVGDVRASIMMGESAGLVLRKDGGEGRPAG